MALATKPVRVRRFSQVTSNHTSRDTQRRFREKHKEALLLKNRQYAEKHRDRLAHYRTVYRQENANKIQHQLKDKKERLVRTLTEDAELKVGQHQ